MTKRTSRWHSPALVSVLLVAGACSVADNLSAPEMIVEIDNILEVGGSGAERTIRYADHADVTAWYMRFWMCWPFRSVLGWTFGVRTREELTAPAGHVRELLLELPDETGGDPVLCVWTAARMAWLAEYDVSPQTRVVAIDGLVQMLHQLELTAFTAPYDQLGKPMTIEAAAIARAGVQTGRPDVRPAAIDSAALAPYRAALASLVAAPQSTPDQRVLLVEELTNLLLAEPDAETREVTEAALRAAVVHMVEGVMLRAVAGRDTDFVPVRLAAMEQMRHLGGPDAVPLLLAAMAASPADRAVVSHFDDDELVQLRLLHYCGQLRGERLRTTVRLPGREDWVPLSPAEFLATTILNQRDYFSKLRIPALVAFSWALDRPRFDPDPQWVRQWHEAELSASNRPR